MVRRVTGVTVAIAAAAAVVAPLAVGLAALVALQLALGWWRTGPVIRRTLLRAAR
jgi:hypothetical protein